MSKNIAVFCSGQPVNGVYREAACQFASLLGKHRYTLVWGALNAGLMRNIADAGQQSGAKLIGITVPTLHEIPRADVDELVVAHSLYHRKELFLSLCHAFVMLTGGIGTLDEIMEITEIKKRGFHDKPIIIINTNNFYDNLIGLMRHMDQEKFFPRPFSELIHVANTPTEAIQFLNNHFGQA